MIEFIKKYKYFCSLFCIFLLLLLFLFVKEHSILFVYNHPNTNTSVLKYLHPFVKHFNSILSVTSDYMGNDGKYRIKYEYKNYYGSGFLLYNPMPNDLDASIGINLGSFEYDGQNSKEIADAVLGKISVFNTAFQEAVSHSSSDIIVSVLSPMDTFQMDSLADNNTSRFFQIALENAFASDKSYIISSYRTPIDNEQLKVLIPFVMNNNEILIENMPPCDLFSEIITYNDSMQTYVREFSVIFDFFIEVKDLRSGEIKRMEVVPESFFGERLQYSRRMFVPNIFTGFSSIAYLNSLKFLKDDDTYLANRLYNFERYIFVFEYNLAKDLMHVKMLKRLHQAVDAFSPLLSKKEKSEFYSIISAYLNDKNLVCLNDVVNIFTILKKITENKQVFVYFRNNGQLEKLDDCFNKTINSLRDSGKFDTYQLIQIENLYKEINRAIYSVDTDNKFVNLHTLVVKNRLKLFKITKRMFPVIVDKDKLLYIDEVLKQKFLKAGYKKIKCYWLDAETIGVVQNDDYKYISEVMFKKFALLSGLPNVNYKYIKQSDLKDKIYAHTDLWIRINTTKEEDSYFENMKKMLLIDRKNYSVKTKFILK